MVISEKSVASQRAARKAAEQVKRIVMPTLCVHEVRDGNWMVPLHINLHAVEDSIRVRLRSNTHILLTEMLNLGIDRHRLLHSK